ncbi:Wzz/FepE/Etk N-terminal domain-containing protein [Aminobacter sp. NyZ550]|uniref:GNVR domain-containing protein n=1 Tax=Aminobacter sp. NyZ550 TaxID=2979870 RepID=UPI0021D5C611|nr:GNVR domain-containing protein [Aminobacter sp. NyZ550]WAX95032.1 Wzz/FepE/Etk N-terminal domain-containing protein [Aminobacter sp. NyZ550]
MAESGNREDWRRKRSLLALDRDDADPKPRGSSLLSMPAEDDIGHEDFQDPATRHRMARFRREAERAAREQLAEKPAAPEAQPVVAQPMEAASAFASDKPAPTPSSMIGTWRDRAIGSVAPEPLAAMPQPSVEPSAQHGDHDDVRWQPLIDPMAVIGGITRSKLLIASTTLAGALLGVALALSTPKKYEAWTEMIVDPRNLRLSDKELTVGDLPSDATLAVVETQVRRLTSGSVLVKVVDKLNLADDPEFNGKAGGGFSVSGFVRSLISSNQQTGDDPGRRHALAAEHLYEALSIQRDTNTFVISVGAKTQDPEKSALIANTMTDVFIQTFGELQAGTAGRATEELTRRLDDLRKSVEAAERKVEAFKAENELINPQGRLITDDEIQRVNDQLTAARARTLELNARAASTRDLGVDSVLAGALPEAIGSPAITELRAQYAALTQEADRAAVRLGPRHPERLAVDAQLSGARERIANELRRVAGSIQVDLKRAVQTEQELAARLAQLKVRQSEVGGEMVTLRELDRDVAAKRAVYEATLLRARETGEQRDINSGNVTIISPASPPLQSTGPSRAMIALGGMLLGFASGVGFGAMRGALQSLRSTARRRSRAKPETRGEPVTATSQPDNHVEVAAPRTEVAPVMQSGGAVAAMDPIVESRQQTQTWQAQPMQQQPGYPAPAYAPQPQPGYDEPPLPHPDYATPQQYRPSYRQRSSDHYSAPPPAPHADAPAPQSQIDEISESLREVRKELNLLRERRSRRYF